MSSAADFRLSRNAYGRLVLTTADGSVHENVSPVRAFPIADPLQGIALVDAEGHELAWVAQLDSLPTDLRKMIEEDLSSREFVPEIEALLDVSSFTTPSDWQVRTDRGVTTFTLKSEDDIRRLSPTTLLISDSHSLHYLLRDLPALDKRSRKLLDRFL